MGRVRSCIAVMQIEVFLQTSSFCALSKLEIVVEIAIAIQ